LTQQQIEAGIQRVMATNKITREDAIKALKEAGKLK
jgi:NACalpha-BTF3-like transcription factor